MKVIIDIPDVIKYDYETDKFKDFLNNFRRIPRL